MLAIMRSMLTDAAEIQEMVGRLSTEKLSSGPVLRRMNRIRLHAFRPLCT